MWCHHLQEYKDKQKTATMLVYKDRVAFMVNLTNEKRQLLESDKNKNLKLMYASNGNLGEYFYYVLIWQNTTATCMQAKKAQYMFTCVVFN